MGYPGYSRQSQKIIIRFDGGLRKWTKEDFAPAQLSESGFKIFQAVFQIMLISVIFSKNLPHLKHNNY